MPTLTAYHTEHAQDFLEHAGGKWPRRYRSLPEEYAAAQTAAMMDRSFIGKVSVRGKDREALLHRLTANEMRNLRVGESRVNMFTNAKGRLVDLFEMLAHEENYLLLAGPSRGATLCKWIDKYTFREDVKPVDQTDRYALFSLFGAQAAARAGDFFALDAAGVSAGHFLKTAWHGEEIFLHHPHAAAVARLNVVAAAAIAAELWRELLAHFPPIGFDTCEILRIKQGLPAADHEIVEDYNPHEVGLLPFINFEKGCYIGQEVIARLDSYQKVQRALAGLQFDAPPAAAVGAAVFAGAQEIGRVTSAAPAITQKFSLGLAVLRKSFIAPGAPVELHLPDGPRAAAVHTLPFPDDFTL